MSSIIELMSSDEEDHEVPVDCGATKVAMPPAPIPTITTKAAVQQEEEVSLHEHKHSIAPKEPTGIEPEKSNPTASISQDKRAHRRKSQHSTVRCPEIEFESLISHNKFKSTSNPNIWKRNSLPKRKDIKKISILAQKPLTCEQLLDVEFEKFLKEEQTLKLIREIAAERVRINQLLSLNFMPEIKFSLYTKQETLKFQISERFRQKEIFLKTFSDTKPTQD